MSNNSLEEKFAKIKDAYGALQLAHDGIYEALLRDQADALTAEEGKVTGEVAQMNGVIEFWAGLGDFRATSSGDRSARGDR